MNNTFDDSPYVTIIVSFEYNIKSRNVAGIRIYTTTGTRAPKYNLNVHHKKASLLVFEGIVKYNGLDLTRQLLCIWNIHVHIKGTVDPLGEGFLRIPDALQSDVSDCIFINRSFKGCNLSGYGTKVCVCKSTFDKVGYSLFRCN